MVCAQTQKQPTKCGNENLSGAGVQGCWEKLKQPQVLRLGWQDRTKPDCFAHIGGGALQAPQTPSASLKQVDVPCQPSSCVLAFKSTGSPAPEPKPPSHSHASHLPRFSSPFWGGTQGRGEVQASPNNCSGEHCIFIAVCVSRVHPACQKPRGRSSSFLCGHTRICVFWQITDILPIYRLFPMLLTTRVSLVQCSVKSQLARSM